MMQDLRVLQEKIGYVFKDETLLKTAFTHSSYAAVKGGADNEKMEYLGDSVLQLVVTERQYFSCENKTEGDFTKDRQKIVSLLPLKESAEKLNLPAYLLYMGGKDNVGAKTISSLYESLIAAIYLDGGYEAAKRFVLAHYPEVSSEENYVGLLQEYFQGKGLPTPTYSSPEKTGEDHAPTFRVTVEGFEKTGAGTGTTIKTAKQRAAKALFEQIKS